VLLLSIIGAVLSVGVVIFWFMGWPYLAGACAAVAVILPWVGDGGRDAA
jgi:hypothetical protein